MKYPSLLSIALLLAIHSSAQRDSSFIKYRNFKNELGISINPLLDEFLNFHTTSDNNFFPSFPTPTYYFWYKRSLGKIALRAKVGWYVTYEKDTGGYNSNSFVDQHDVDIFFRPGIEGRHYFGRHWQLNYGGEIISSYGDHIDHYDFSNLSAPKHTIITWAIGAAPFVGASFILNSRLSFGTESSIDFFYQHYHGRYEYFDTPENNTDEVHKHSAITFTYPVYISFIVRF